MKVLEKSWSRRSRGALARAAGAAALLGVVACGGASSAERDALLDTPVDMYRGASSILIHRPLPTGTSIRVQGVFRKHRRVTATSSGYVVHQQTDNLQMAYDLGKRFVEVDLNGNPKRVRYDVAVIESSDADLKPFAALGEGRVVRLQGPGADRVFSSGGQSFDVELLDGKRKISMLGGQLSPVERLAVLDPFGPGYELWLERQLARMFGPKEPQREGNEWDIDLDLARGLLVTFGDLAPPMKITGKATFVGIEQSEGVPVQRVEAWIKGEGALRTDITKKIHASNNRIELKYSGLFPVDLSLPPVAHDWVFKAKGNVIIEVSDVLGDIEQETRFEHQSRITEVRR
jgi:hypothetical protein